MSDTAIIEFEIDPTGQGDRALQNKVELLERIERQAEKVGSPLDRLTMQSIRNFGIPALQQFEQQLGRVESQANRTVAAINRIQPRQGLTPDQAAFIRHTSSAQATGDPEDRVLLRRFDSAARGLAETRDAATGTIGPIRDAGDAADISAQRFKRLSDAAGELRQNLKQAAGRDSILGDLTDFAAGGAAGVAVGAIAAIGAAAIVQSQRVREQAEADLRVVQNAANFGVRGGFQQRTSEREQIQEAIREAQERAAESKDADYYGSLRMIDEADRLRSQRLFGTSATENFISRQIRSGEETLNRATSPAQRELANKVILDATRDFSALTQQQADARLQALTRQLDIENQRAA